MPPHPPPAIPPARSAPPNELSPDQSGILAFAARAIYSCKQGGEWLSPWTDNPSAAIASVSRVEALGFPGISEEEESAIRPRRQKKMGTADAIIAATALEFGLPLVTRNVDDFKHIAELEINNPFAEQHD